MVCTFVVAVVYGILYGTCFLSVRDDRTTFQMVIANVYSSDFHEKLPWGLVDDYKSLRTFPCFFSKGRPTKGGSPSGFTLTASRSLPSLVLLDFCRDESGPFGMVIFNGPSWGSGSVNDFFFAMLSSFSIITWVVPPPRMQSSPPGLLHF